MGMMQLLFTRRVLTPLVVVVLAVRAFAVLLTAPLASCAYTPPHPGLCAEAAGAPLTELTDRAIAIAFEAPGTVIALHGSGCGKSNQSGSENFIKVEDKVDLPRYVTNATVFLNGFRSRYLSKDHHVAGLGTLIGNIQLEGTSLKWQAASVLADHNFDDGYTSCYFFTVLGWNAAAIDIRVAHDDGCFSKTGNANFFIANNDAATTALSAFATFLENPSLAGGSTIAVLPRGYGFRWGGNDDRHLLQLAYNLDHSEVFIQAGKVHNKGGTTATPAVPNSRVGSGFVSWETYGIFKENDARHDYDMGEIVSGLGGRDVGIVQPPLAVLPDEDDSFTTCVGSGGAVHSEGVIVENVPYEYALPMLTGWEVGYDCDDEHVTELGAWIDEFSYDRPPGAPTGTLRYKISSTLRDKDGSPGHVQTLKASILGLRPLAPGKSPIKGKINPG